MGKVIPSFLPHSVLNKGAPTAFVLLLVICTTAAAPTAVKRDINANEWPWCSIDGTPTDQIKNKIRVNTHHLLNLAQELYYPGNALHMALEGMSGNAQEACLPFESDSPNQPTQLRNISSFHQRISFLNALLTQITCALDMEGQLTQTAIEKIDMCTILLTRLENYLEEYLKISQCSCPGSDCIISDFVNKTAVYEKLASSSSCTSVEIFDRVLQLIGTNVFSLRQSTTDWPENGGWSFCSMVHNVADEIDSYCVDN